VGGEVERRLEHLDFAVGLQQQLPATFVDLPVMRVQSRTRLPAWVGAPGPRDHVIRSCFASQASSNQEMSATASSSAYHVIHWWSAEPERVSASAARAIIG
jgi:hypothetical protein